MSGQHDAWTAGDSYERYMGRWSRQIASRFVEWLDPPARLQWLEIGCGTGALTAAILTDCDPKSVLAVDQSDDFVRHTEAALRDERLRFATAEAGNLPADEGSLDVAVSGLVLNFIPDRIAALREMQRVLRPGGLIAFYVWDYPGRGMGIIDAFWRAAALCEPEAARNDEASRFPFCTREGLAALCAEAGLGKVETAPLEIVTRFDDFDGFWHPFTLGAGPAPGYFRSLGADRQERLKRAVAAEVGADSPISLPARAWAVRAAPR